MHCSEFSCIPFVPRVHHRALQPASAEPLQRRVLRSFAVSRSAPAPAALLPCSAEPLPAGRRRPERPFRREARGGVPSLGLGDERMDRRTPEWSWKMDGDGPRSSSALPAPGGWGAAVAELRRKRGDGGASQRGGWRRTGPSGSSLRGTSNSADWTWVKQSDREKLK